MQPKSRPRVAMQRSISANREMIEKPCNVTNAASWNSLASLAALFRIALRMTLPARPAALLAILLAACVLLTSAPTSAARLLDTTIKMAFIYPGSPREGAGWTFQHDLGRQAIEKQFGRQVIVTIKENVDVADVDSVIRQLARDGNTFIFSTSPEYADATLRAAKVFPKVQFEQVGTEKQARSEEH